MRGLGAEQGKKVLEVNTGEAIDLGLDRTTWMLVSANEEFMAVAASARRAGRRRASPVVVWTDAFSSLLAVIKPR